MAVTATVALTEVMAGTAVMMTTQTSGLETTVALPEIAVIGEGEKGAVMARTVMRQTNTSIVPMSIDSRRTAPSPRRPALWKLRVFPKTMLKLTKVQRLNAVSMSLPSHRTGKLCYDPEFSGNVLILYVLVLPLKSLLRLPNLTWTGTRMLSWTRKLGRRPKSNVVAASEKLPTREVLELQPPLFNHCRLAKRMCPVQHPLARAPLVS